MAIIKDWISVLLLHLIRCPKTVTRALDKVTPQDIADVSSADFGFLWYCSQEYFRKYARLIPLPFMESKLAERMQINQMDEMQIGALVELLSWVYTTDEKDLEPSEAATLIKRLLQQTRVSAPLHQMLSEGKTVDEIFGTMQTGMFESAVGMAEPLDPLACLQEIMDGADPTPLGGNDIQYFNRLCQGGLKPGEVLFVIGPQKGYKTTMAVDVICSMAKMHEVSMFLAYEQSADAGDLKIRFLSRLSGIPRSILENKERRAAMSEADKAKMVAAQLVSPYIKWFDRSRSVDRMADVAGQVQELIQLGTKPELVILDQFLPWVQRWPECERKPELIRVVGLKALDDIKHQVAERFDTRVVILHQMTDEKVGRSSAVKPKASDSAEIKGVGRWVDFVVNFGTECKETNCFWALANSTRRGVYTQLILRALGDFCRLEIAEDMTEHSEFPGKFVKRGEENKLSRHHRPGLDSITSDF